MEWRRATRTLYVFVLLVLGFIVVSQLVGHRAEEVEVKYYFFEDRVTAGEVREAVIVGRTLHGTYKDGGKFRTTLPMLVDSELLGHWRDSGVALDFRAEKPDLGSYLLSLLPWILIIGFTVFMLRRMQGVGPKGLFSFGKSKARLVTESKTKVTFSDVAGVDEAKEELREIIEFLKNPRKFARLGGRIPRGVLLLGPPGTGKTLLAKAVAGEAGVPFFSISGAEFVEMFVGVGASRVRDLFETGKKHAPCIIFIDEIDAVGRQRGAGLGGGHDEREQTLNQLLIEMDGFEENDGVILIAATNRPDILDSALLRPGRFDRQIVVDRPDVRGRQGILKVHAKNKPLAEGVDLEIIAKGTPGMAGAELSNLMNEAALIAARRNADKITLNDLEAAKDKVTMGIERKSLVISPEEKKSTAYHEAGHVIVSKYTEGQDPVHKVTIIPRGQALGLTHYVPLDDKHSYSRSYLEGRLAILMGGRAAEWLTFGDYTTGAANDLKRATEMAKRMVTQWGMSDALGPLTYGQKSDEVFLGRDYTHIQDYSDDTARQIDEAVRLVVERAATSAESILARERDRLNRLALTLVERESLDAREIDEVLGLTPVTDDGLLQAARAGEAAKQA
ncbi:ATP-dependent metallopeptidase FtsH/Yme1/Tma family protein [candidate division KSB1 bacterium]|nr:ATP-dependent metallopeptidase FtsH/Yme1/Tma family protein [candidate division KSB1 bacterium]